MNQTHPDINEREIYGVPDSDCEVGEPIGLVIKRWEAERKEDDNQ